MNKLSIYEQADILWNMPEGERNQRLMAMSILSRKAMIAFMETRKARLRESKED